MATAAFAQASPALENHPLLPVIAEAESQGQNVPNFRYDQRHTAGGILQITDTNWRTYAPQLDIDVNKYPNALSAPLLEQRRVGGLMLAREGVNPWTCCNDKLRRQLGDGTVVPVSAKPKAPEPEIKQAQAPEWSVLPPPRIAKKEKTNE
jgi:hypothetical protein